MARLVDRLAPGQAAAQRAFAILLACVCLVYGLLAVQRARVWRSDLTLWQHTVEQVPSSLRARLGLMSAYQRAERLDQALVVGREAAELAPGNWKVHMNLGIIHARQQRPEPALEELRLARELGGEGKPELADALAGAHFQAGNVEQAIAVLTPVLERYPADSRLLLSLGKLELAAGRYRRGIATLERAARLRPRDPEPPRLAAKAWLRQGDLDAAAQSARRAVALDPADPRNAALLEHIERRSGR
jgi:Flp pilus assembly protein TadD